jgi:hypothetical protein
MLTPSQRKAQIKDQVVLAGGSIVWLLIVSVIQGVWGWPGTAAAVALTVVTSGIQAMAIRLAQREAIKNKEVER